MKAQKLLVLFVGSVVITAIVLYQLKYFRRTSSPPASVARQEPAPVQTAAVNPQTSEASVRSSSPPVQTSIPAQGWGRNPFLTPKEIVDLAPSLPTPTANVEPVIPLPPPPPMAPPYRVMAIVSNRNGMLALIDRVGSVRVGDRIGKEQVKEITPEAIVLEQDGKTRQLALGATPPQTAPKGEVKP